MNLKSKTYMRNAEFRIRQFWLPFVDAVGIVLKELEEIKAKAWTWYKNWNKKSTKKHFINLTPPLNFEHMNHREWQRKRNN
ncbi:hypothetical protein GALL_70910 [mine drainage metagenome]|uniref:Uncharacterized protein n=1 Tax=mine drainage metagenome TaxID=410659 RepID=A0A1J5SSG3_9ZZZZ